MRRAFSLCLVYSFKKQVTLGDKLELVKVATAVAGAAGGQGGRGLEGGHSETDGPHSPHDCP